MNLNKKDLRKIMYDFNSISNRLMQADFHDYNSILKKFLMFISNTEIINEFIKDCGNCEFNLEEEFSQIQNSYGTLTFTLGETVHEEVCNVFAYLNFINDNDIDICDRIAMGYSGSTKYQDMVKGFNDRVVYVLIRHIEGYLTKIGIDMGVDEKNAFNITIKNGQVNIANDNSTLTAYNNISFNLNELDKLIEDVKKISQKEQLSSDDEEQLNCNLEVISEELKSKQPRKSFIKTAVEGMKMIKGTAEFGAAITTLIQFVLGCI